MATVDIGHGWHPDPGASLSLHADAYTERRWFDADQAEIIRRTWQWIGHAEKFRTPGSYAAVTIADMPVLVLRDHDGALRAFYNVCRHRAHELVSGEGRLRNLDRRVSKHPARGYYFALNPKNQE